MNSVPSPMEMKQAQMPHELFLINLIFNHILLFIATISAPSLQFTVVIVPLVSIGIMGYTLLRARSASDAAYVNCHWRLAARRTWMFAGMWILVGLFFGAILLAAGGHPKPFHYAIAVLAFMPSMLVTLALIMLEGDALQHARAGTLPSPLQKRCVLRRLLVSNA